MNEKHEAEMREHARSVVEREAALERRAESSANGSVPRRSPLGEASQRSGRRPRRRRGRIMRRLLSSLRLLNNHHASTTGLRAYQRGSKRRD